MKKILTIIMFLFYGCLLFSGEVIKFKDIKIYITNSSREKIKHFIKEIIDKKLEKETGWVLCIKDIDSSSDIVYIEMEKPSKNFEMNIADLFFKIDKKISNKLNEYQLIFFNATIKDYDFKNEMFELSDIYLSGLM